MNSEYLSPKESEKLAGFSVETCLWMINDRLSVICSMTLCSFLDMLL